MDTFARSPGSAAPGRAARRASSATSSRRAASRSPATRASSCAARSSGPKELGYIVNTGPELEFFLFRRDEDGRIEPLPHDQAGYFDFSTDLAQEIRQDMVDALEAFGIRVEAAHHEVAAGQHEIDFEYADALRTADNAITFKFTLKAIAQQHGLYATFMPKPIHGINGSGMHTHQSLWSIAEARNAFADATNPYGLSDLARSYMAGILAHARGMIAVLAPLVNSYKRLVPGLRGADLPHLGPDQPLGAHPRADGLARQVDRGHPLRGPLPGSVVEHVPGLRGDARGRPRRRREGHDARRPGRGVPLRDGRGAIAAKAIRELPGTLGEALDELEDGRGHPRRARRPRLQPLRRGQARRVGRVPHPGLRTGRSSATSSSSRGRRAGNPASRRHRVRRPAASSGARAYYGGGRWPSVGRSHPCTSTIPLDAGPLGP